MIAIFSCPKLTFKLNLYAVIQKQLILCLEMSSFRPTSLQKWNSHSCKNPPMNRAQLLKHFLFLHRAMLFCIYMCTQHTYSTPFFIFLCLLFKILYYVHCTTLYRHIDEINQSLKGKCQEKELRFIPWGFALGLNFGPQTSLTIFRSSAKNLGFFSCLLYKNRLTD